MREAIGGTWLLGLVLTFIVFFVSFLAVSVNYSKAFNVKNNVVDIISKYEGNSCEARKKIKTYLSSVGYMVSGSCSEGYFAYDANGDYQRNGKGYYCVKKDIVETESAIVKNFYSVEVFFRLDVPTVENLLTFRIKGETEPIYFPAGDGDEKKDCSGS